MECVVSAYSLVVNQPDDDDGDGAPRGVPGKWVIVAIFAVSIVASTVAMIFVRPNPQEAPADVDVLRGLSLFRETGPC